MNKDKKKYDAKLDPYESEILEAYETGKLIMDESDIDFQAIAKNTIKTNKKINIRIADNDLNALKRRAAREGIPYQTLIRSILHKYASGFLKDSFNT
jgi:predicted DNA binding CopG/RHH family protein